MTRASPFVVLLTLVLTLSLLFAISFHLPADVHTMKSSVPERRIDSALSPGWEFPPFVRDCNSFALTSLLYTQAATTATPTHPYSLTVHIHTHARSDDEHIPSLNLTAHVHTFHLLLLGVLTT